jgi:HEAT repeat protein
MKIQCTHLRFLILVSIVVAATTPSAFAQVTTQDAADYLVETLNGDDALAGIAALAATNEDEQLKWMFLALARSDRKEVRLFTVTAIPSALGSAGDVILADRLRKDALMSVRSEAMAQLVTRDAAPLGVLREAILIDDDTIQLMAAKALARNGELIAAKDTLETLTQSSDPDLAANARLALFEAGDDTQLPPLQSYMTSADTSPLGIELLLSQIRNQDTERAAPLVEAVLAMEDISPTLAVQAYRAMVVTDHQATLKIARAISDTDNPNLKVMLFTILAEQPDAMRHLERFATDDNALIRSLAEFELARLSNNESAPDIISTVFRKKTPLLTGYIFHRASEDVRNDDPNVGMYVPGLIAQMLAANPEADTMGLDHVKAAQAATMLSDIGTPDAMDALKDVLSESHNARVRAVAAGMLHSQNVEVCELMVPLLDSPYSELWTDAALVLGRFGDLRAEASLQRIIENSSRHGPLMSTQACWYLIKLDPDTKTLATGIAKRIE